MNGALDLKANQVTTYTIAEVNTELGKKFDKDYICCMVDEKHGKYHPLNTTVYSRHWIDAQVMSRVNTKLNNQDDLVKASAFNYNYI